MKRPIAPTQATGLQCLSCGHVEAPARDLFLCLACNGLDTRPFVADVLEDRDDEQVLDLRDFK